jgi:hypothetical protein
MQSVTQFLDNLRLGTLTFIIGSALLIVGYTTGGVTFDAAWKDFLYLGGASGAIGVMRTHAGKGVRAVK